MWGGKQGRGSNHPISTERFTISNTAPMQQPRKEERQEIGVHSSITITQSRFHPGVIDRSWGNLATFGILLSKPRKTAGDFFTQNCHYGIYFYRHRALPIVSVESTGRSRRRRGVRRSRYNPKTAEKRAKKPAAACEKHRSSSRILEGDEATVAILITDNQLRRFFNPQLLRLRNSLSPDQILYASRSRGKMPLRTHRLRNRRNWIPAEKIWEKKGKKRKKNPRQ